MSIPDATRRAWNHLLAKLLIGKTVTLDNRDADWLLQIGAGAVSWHEAQGGEPPAISTTENPKPKKKGKAKK